MTANATLTGSIQRSKKWLALPVGCVVLSLGLLTGGVPAAHAEADATGESPSTSTSETAELPGEPVVEADAPAEVDADVDDDAVPEASLDEQPAAAPVEVPATDSDVEAAKSIAEQQAVPSAKSAPVAEAPASSNAVAAAGDAPYDDVNDSWWDFPEPTLSGRPQVGKKLTATHVPAPAGSASVSYQWYRTDVRANGDMVKINGATGRSYTPTNADVDDWLTFQIRIVKNSTLYTKFGLSVGPIRTNATFVAPAKSPFVDVAKTTQFYTPISWMKKSAVSTGTKAGAYLPKDGVSREAMAAFIYRYQGAALYSGPSTSPFADVKPGDKFYNEIAWMYETGLSTGVKQKNGKPKYQPKARVSREAMAAFIYRLEAKNATTPKTTPFRDVKTSDKFYKEIAWMSSSGLSTGIKQSSGKPKYAPKSTVSREAMAAFLFRLEAK